MAQTPITAMEILMLIGGVGVCAIGVAALLLVRLRSHGRIAPRVPVLHKVSDVTGVVIGLACLGVGYHLGADALGLTDYAAPLWVAALIGAGAVAASLGVDAMERSGEESEP